ncbi:MAG: TIGR01459 family HAD-type hydrolase [Pseudomonadota bacterium]|nr:TIGR01459 family HAD-type hydrolase [Pseudomonadota bacterium]
MPPAPQLVSGLSEIASRYDAVLCDIWGVVHNGRAAHQEACEALVRFRETGRPVVLISNAPRRSSAVIGQLDGLGVPREAWSGVVTSGDATRSALQERSPGPVWAIGPERDATLYEGLDLRFSGAEEAAFICCTGLYDDRTETGEDYRERLREPARRGLELICANPDRVVQIGDRLIPCAGAIADVYEELGGTVIMEGKPYAPIYDLALAALGPVDPSRVLAIGDAVATDVLGANNRKLDCLFVAEGIHGEDLNGGRDPEAARALLAARGAHAAFLAPRLAWG